MLRFVLSFRAPAVGGCGIFALGVHGVWRRYLLRRNGRRQVIQGVAGHRCDGPIEADHAGARPAGRKADDATCIPLCMLAHRQRTDFAGPFRAWDRVTMRGFLAAAIASTAAAYQRHQAALAAAASRPA